MRYAQGKRAFGFCDRCYQRFDLKELKYQPYDQKPLRLRVCVACLDKDHPQLQLGKVPVYDPQALYDPRPDTNPGSGLFGWKPVGNPAQYLTGSVGQVQVTTGD